MTHHDTPCHAGGGLPSDFDVLSIDIDGADYHVWDGLRGSRFAPALVVIEFNPTIPNHVAFVARVHHGTPWCAMT